MIPVMITDIQEGPRVTSPLGDENYIKFPRSVDMGYDSLLDKAINTIFPNNHNAVAGTISDYKSFEIANSQS